MRRPPEFLLSTNLQSPPPPSCNHHPRQDQVDKTAQNNGFSTTRVAFHPGDHGFFTTSGAQHLRLWYTSSDNVLKAHGILPQAKEQARIDERPPTGILEALWLLRLYWLRFLSLSSSPRTVRVTDRHCQQGCFCTCDFLLSSAASSRACAYPASFFARAHLLVPLSSPRTDATIAAKRRPTAPANTWYAPRRPLTQQPSLSMIKCVRSFELRMPCALGTPLCGVQDNFTDHTWIPGTAGQPTRMVAITDGEDQGHSRCRAVGRVGTQAGRVGISNVSVFPLNRWPAAPLVSWQEDEHGANSGLAHHGGQ